VSLCRRLRPRRDRWRVTAVRPGVDVPRPTARRHPAAANSLSFSRSSMLSRTAGPCREASVGVVEEALPTGPWDRRPAARPAGRPCHSSTVCAAERSLSRPWWRSHLPYCSTPAILQRLPLSPSVRWCSGYYTGDELPELHCRPTYPTVCRLVCCRPGGWWKVSEDNERNRPPTGVKLVPQEP